MIRNTKQKDLILQAVYRHDQHPTADDIYQELKAEHPRLSLATVYRNLNQFAELGYLGRVNVEGEPLHFDSRPEPHVHAICSGCGAIIDIENAELNQNLREYAGRLAELEGFELAATDLKYLGRCTSCRKD